MTWLVVNADDFGQTHGINAGIVQAHREGIVTSATLMANGVAFADAVGLAQSHQNLGVGVHLNLVEGRPTSSPEHIQSLLNDDGTLPSKFNLIRRHLTGRLKLDELRREVESQIDCVQQAGIKPTHVDSHKNIHAYPPFFTAIAAAAESCGVSGIRIPFERSTWSDWLACPRGIMRMSLLNIAAHFSRCRLDHTKLTVPDIFGGTIRTGVVTAGWLVRWMHSLNEGTAELMVHPGWSDEPLKNTGTRLLASREVELHALCDPAVVAAVADLGIKLVHYGDLADRSLVVPPSGGKDRD